MLIKTTYDFLPSLEPPWRPPAVTLSKSDIEGLMFGLHFSLTHPFNRTVRSCTGCFLIYLCSLGQGCAERNIRETPQPSVPLSTFWQTQRVGTNLFNTVETGDRLAAARSTGVQFVRLTFSKWASARVGAKPGEFLIGDLDHYQGLIPADLARLRSVLDDAHALGLKVILVPLNLPGNRWRQQNGDQNDLRLWADLRFHEQAAAFWKDLAQAVREHPAVIGYNLKNEPEPERAAVRFNDWLTEDHEAWCRQVEGTAADVNLLYQRIHRAIREADVKTTIILDGSFYATPWAMGCLQPLADNNIIYSFHMYEPYAFVWHGNQGRFSYPGTIPVGESDQPELRSWNRAALDAFLTPVRNWQQRYRLPAEQVLVGEFGTYRLSPGADRYLSDLISIFDAAKWHWAFYSFREDEWPGMDYELGTVNLPETYWSAVERGERPSRTPWYEPNSIWSVFKNRLLKAQ